MSRTTRAVATLVVVGIITTVAPLVRAVPASAARPKTIAIADAAIVEGDAGTKSLAFNVTWTGARGGGAVSVAYATADGTATAGSDYTAKSGTVFVRSNSEWIAATPLVLWVPTMARFAIRTFRPPPSSIRLTRANFASSAGCFARTSFRNRRLIS